MNVNRKYKDSVFTALFNDKEKLVELYNALEGTDYKPDETDVEIATLQDMLFMEQLNDVSFTVNGKLVILIEHQSTINENMPVRCLMYIGRVYEKLLEADNVYRRKLIPIPTPEFIVLYNGADALEDEKVLKLSSAFIEQGINELELSVRVVNINKGRNEAVTARSRTLNDYVKFTSRVRENKEKGVSLEAAIEEAVRYCEEHGILAEFLRKNGSEVVNMLYAEFNLDDARRVWTEEGKEEGKQEEKIETAINLLRKGMDIPLISEVTGLSEKAIEKLRDDLAKSNVIK